MRFRVYFFSLLVVAVFLAMPIFRPVRLCADQKKGSSSSSIGVVCLRRVFEQCKRNAAYRAEATAQKESIVAELEKLTAEIEADKASLRALKPGSSDYLALMKEALNNQARLQAQQEFHKKQMELKDQRWTEQLYEDVLKHVGAVARAKGLDLVFEKDEVELPAAALSELMLTIRTHKLLYSEGCVDITAEVLAQLDSEHN